MFHLSRYVSACDDMMKNVQWPTVFEERIHSDHQWLVAWLFKESCSWPLLEHSTNNPVTSILEAQSRAQGRLHVTKQQSKTNVERNIAILSSTKFVPKTPDKNTLNMDFNFWGGKGAHQNCKLKRQHQITIATPFMRFTSQPCTSAVVKYLSGERQNTLIDHTQEFWIQKS